MFDKPTRSALEIWPHLLTQKDMRNILSFRRISVSYRLAEQVLRVKYQGMGVEPLGEKSFSWKTCGAIFHPLYEFPEIQTYNDCSSYAITI